MYFRFCALSGIQSPTTIAPYPGTPRATESLHNLKLETLIMYYCVTRTGSSKSLKRTGNSIHNEDGRIRCKHLKNGRNTRWRQNQVQACEKRQRRRKRLVDSLLTNHPPWSNPSDRSQDLLDAISDLLTSSRMALANGGGNALATCFMVADKSPQHA